MKTKFQISIETTRPLTDAEVQLIFQLADTVITSLDPGVVVGEPVYSMGKVPE